MGLLEPLFQPYTAWSLEAMSSRSFSRRQFCPDYPVTRKEVMNYRNRQAEAARCAQLEQVDLGELASILGEQL